MGTARWCVVCGTALARRPTAEIEAELAAVRFLLAEMPTWQQVTPDSRAYLRGRYERLERVLGSALTEVPPAQVERKTGFGAKAVASADTGPAVASVPVGDESASAGASSALQAAATEVAGTLDLPADGGVRPVDPDAALRSAASEGGEGVALRLRADGPTLSVNGGGEGVALRLRADGPTLSVNGGGEGVALRLRADGPTLSVNGGRGGGRVGGLGLPASAAEPMFDVPEVPTATEKIIERTSTWSRVWRPFLVESVGWFIGAFLILAGTFYGVAESWAQMSSMLRALVVFGIAAGWSAGFGIWGWYLGRRENTRTAARVLGLIAAVISPLAAIALQSLAEPSPLLFWPVLLAWAAGSGFLARRPAESYDPASARLLQAGVAGTTLLMGAAPFLARAGSPMFWLDAAPVLLLWTVVRPPAGARRSSEQLAYVLLAPAYLAALFGIRLHLALAAAGALPPLGTYAPFLAVIAAAAVRARTRDEAHAGDAVSIGAICVQVTLVLFSALGEAPAFFATALVGALTSWQLSFHGPVRRARWLYPAYAFGYLAYQSCGQLVPGVLKALITAVKAQLGYQSQPLPFAFNSVYAALFVAVVGLLAARWWSRPDERRAAIAESLLRSTAVASVLFCLIALVGPDARPGVYAIPVFASLCLAVGLWRGRDYLALTGAGLTLLLSASLLWHFGPASGALLVSALALLLAVLSVPLTRVLRQGFALGVVVHCCVVALLAWSGPPSGAQVLALAVAGAAALLVAFNNDQLWGIALAFALGTSAVPRLFLWVAPEFAPLALAAAGLALALLAHRQRRFRQVALTAIAAAVLAVPWQLALQIDSTSAPRLLGWVLVLASASAFLCARKARAVLPLGVLFATLALLPAMEPLTAWPWLTPELSVLAFAAVCLGASLWTARRGASLTPVLFASFSLAGAVVAIVAGEAGPALLAVAAIGALLSARALHPGLSVPLAAALALGAIVQLEPWMFLALAAGLAAIALFEEWDLTWTTLLGRRPVALAASLSSLAVALLYVLASLRGPSPAWHLVPLVALPLGWVRATRKPLFGFPLLPLVALFGLHFRPSGALPWLVPILAVVLTRLSAHLPAFRTLLFGAKAPLHAARRFKQVLLVSLAFTGAGLTAYTGLDDPWLICGLAGAFLLGAGGPFPARLALAALFFAVVPWTRLPSAGLFLALAFASHHAPKALHRALGADEDELSLPVAVVAALTLVTLRWTLAAPSPEALFTTAACALLAALLLSRRWLVTAAVLLAAAAPLTARHHGWELPLAQELFLVALVVFAAALFAAVLRSASANSLFDRATRAVSPGLEASVASALWVGAALALALALLARRAVGFDAPAVLLVASALALLVTPRPAQSALATALLGAALAQAIPAPWAPVAIAFAGALLCLSGHLIGSRHPVGEALHHSGWVLAGLALFGVRQLGHPSTTLAFAGAASAAWAVALRRRALEPLAWIASLAAAHVALFYLGVVFSTGKPQAFILPYLASASALFAVLALLAAGAPARRGVGLGFGLLALLEVASGLMLIGMPAPQEAWIAGLCLGVLFVALVHRALAHADEAAAYLAQVVLGVAYLVVRVHGMGAGQLSGGDALAGLVAGAIFCGLYAWALREGEGRKVLVGPALLGAFLFPLVGLLVAPWSDSLQASLLLVGHAAHFAALARNPSQRRAGALLSAAAFNAALVCTWLGAHTADPQYFVIPAGISLLLLVRVFRADLSVLAQARLRAVAITLIYAAGAWKPLTFDAPWAMLLCVFVCVVGVAVGVGLRIRSYVYLGTAFLVTTVLANLVRYGVRDPRLGAVFLSALGLSVVTFMVLLSTRRADLLRRYDRARQLLELWEG